MKRFILVAAVLIAGFVACKPSKHVSPAFNLLLITLDTTRADRIGAYGFKDIQTPSIDALAREGILFEKCISPTPLTLPAHTSIMTGTYPLFHGVRDNAAFIVPQNLTTLAETFKANKYATAAFVSSFVLDSQWGLNQGFDEYYDHFDLHQDNVVSVGDIQRPGNQTVDAALQWLRKNQKQHFFLWVHLYDPHSPYDPPQPFKNQYAGRPYLGEIAFADSQVGRLLQFLAAAGLRGSTNVVVAGDHGESLGEHEEDGHGFFVYQAAVHVPLIISSPLKALHGLRRNELVSLVDIMPTVLQLSGVRPQGQLQGHSLLKEEARLAYSESFYPRFHFGWSELQTIQDDRYKLILSSEPEFYDLKNDPAESKNLISEQRQRAEAFTHKAHELIAQWSKGAHSQDYSQLDDETKEKLAALGYIGTFQETTGKSNLPSPRNKINLYNRLSAARELALEQDFAGAEKLIQAILKEDPGMIDAHTALGNLYLKQKRFQEAADNYERALKIKPDDVSILSGLAGSELALGKKDEAEKLLTSSLSFAGSDSRIHFLLGNIYRSKGEEAKAKASFEECLKRNPRSASAHNALAAIYIEEKQIDQARKHVEAAAKLDAGLPGIHYMRAQIFEQNGDPEKAINEYRKELEVSGTSFRAAYNLSAIYRERGNSAEEERYLKKAIEMNQDFPLSYLYLARLRLKSGDRYEEAIDLVKQSLALNPEGKYRALAYYLLADLYDRIGQPQLSQQYAARARRVQQ